MKKRLQVFAASFLLCASSSVAQHALLDVTSSARVAFGFHTSPGTQAMLRQEGRLLAVAGTISSGGWTSVRHVFREPRDLTPYQSVELILTVGAGVGLKPRVTLLDHTAAGGDEFFWLTFRAFDATGPYRACGVIREDSVLGFGQGSRRNDGQLKSPLVGYEVNLLNQEPGAVSETFEITIQRLTLHQSKNCSDP